MNGKTYINGDELTSLANSLKSKSESILNTYKGDCSQAIQMSSDCLQLSGLNTTEFFQALEKIYTQVNDRINSFADFLTNVVVAEYNAVSEAITNSFNNEFANEIAGLLGITVTQTIGPISSPAVPGKPIPAPGSVELTPVTPKPGDSIPKQPKNPVIELDPREKDGFNKPITANDDVKAVAFGEGEASTVKPLVKPDLPSKPESNVRGTTGNSDVKAVAFGEGEASTVKPLVKPDIPSTSETTVRGTTGNSDVKAVAFDEGISSSASVAPVVKPEIPTSPVIGGRGHDANGTIKAVQFDGGSVGTVAPIKPTTPKATITTPPPAAPIITPPKPSVKPNLPSLPTKPSVSSGSFSRGTTIGGGGGGAMGATNIAFDSGLTNPLKLRF